MTLPKPIPAIMLLFESFPAKWRLIDKNRMLNKIPKATDTPDFVTCRISLFLSDGSYLNRSFVGLIRAAYEEIGVFCIS